MASKTAFQPLFRSLVIRTPLRHRLPGSIEHHRETVSVVKNAISRGIRRNGGHDRFGIG